MHVTHVIKELVGTAAMPLAAGLLLAAIGAIVRLFGLRRISTIFWIAAATLVYLSSISPVANALLRPLEGRYPPFDGTIPPVSFIVVLGNGYQPRDGIPITAALAADGLVRISEGVRLMRLIHGARLVVSGGAYDGQTPTALGYAEYAADLGVDADAIIKLDKPLDTAEEAGEVAALVGASPFVLVTSAYHMPRAVRLMEIAGAHPIPAPTGQLAPRKIDFSPRGWIPRSDSLRKTERALHEYMGMAIAS